jgi:hypothetical protein
MEYLKEFTPSGVGFNQEEIDLYLARLNGGSITPDFRTFPSATVPAPLNCDHWHVHELTSWITAFGQSSKF